MSDSLFLNNDKEILFIEGIDINKINYDLHEDFLVKYDEYDNYDIINNQYDKIKTIFTNYNTWEVNNISCWYCTLNFNEKAVFIPKSIKKNYIEVYGNFCSFSCTLKYINIYFKYDNNKRCQIINNLKHLYNEYYNKDIEIINEAPDKELLNKFGGPLSIEDYKKKIHH